MSKYGAHSIHIGKCVQELHTPVSDWECWGRGEKMRRGDVLYKTFYLP
jgi:hypothetical protein